jgi:DNA-binding NarL/FixJ family response regulator
MTGPIKVAVIDDHPLFREGVANTIQRSGAVQVIAEGETADDAIEIAKAKLPDIVLLDVSLPGGGMEAARAIVKACPVVKIIMLTVSESEEHVQQAMAAGVHGYVLKGTSGPELINTLRAVARGEYYVTPRVSVRTMLAFANPGLSGRTEDHFRQWRLLFAGVYNWEKGPWRPFATFGAGVHFVRLMAADTNDISNQGFCCIALARVCLVCFRQFHDSARDDVAYNSVFCQKASSVFSGCFAVRSKIEQQHRGDASRAVLSQRQK